MGSPSKAHSARIRCRWRRSRTILNISRSLKNLDEELQGRRTIRRKRKFIDELAALSPVGNRRMGGNPHVNGGRELITLALPDFTDYALEIPGPGQVLAEAPRKLGDFFRDIFE